ncbi:MAG: ATP-binding protein [Spirochaetes bacterium]|nr:ATP-binding protein [Spirochaetota bacterium]
MKSTLFLKKLISSKARLQDFIFLLGIFFFAALLIVGLFPTSGAEEEMGKIYFLYLMMSIPVIAAIYFIIVSFRRQIYLQSSEITTSIRFKIAIAFVFVAIIPSLPIIILTNRIVHHTISQYISERDTQAMEESLKMANETISSSFDDIRYRLEIIANHGLDAVYPALLKQEEKLKSQGFGICLYTLVHGIGFVYNSRYLPNEFTSGMGIILNTIPPNQGVRIYNISIGAHSVVMGALREGNKVLILYKKVPEILFARIALYQEALGRYQQRYFLKPYLQTGIGIFLLILSIIIVILSISVSYFLSNSITKPVYELASAARQIASGNFSIHLERDSEDEMAMLFKSFNKMSEQLRESREIMYQKQKLQAWHDIARKLVHEIKNPLTPIRLSAERIRKRFFENHPDLATIIERGTATIIEEVDSLMEIISEFSRFARLPEAKLELGNLNAKIVNCVEFFKGHEQINFHLSLDENLPPLYFDKILIRQVMVNLIQNAIDSLNGKGNVWISTYFDREKNAARISIKDDGVGIKEEDIPKIFEPNFSLKEHGSGLGLAIVEKIIFEHKGRIKCHSKLGEGAEFIIEFPRIHSEEANGKNSHS